MGEDECGAGDVADSAGAGIAGGAPAAGPRDGCAADCTLDFLFFGTLELTAAHGFLLADDQR